MSLVVFGSINMDLVARVPRLPVPGETLIGDRFLTVPGGKGANQAVAAARLGMATTMVGRVGSDRFGQDLITSLHKSQVNTEGIFVDPDKSSGVAMISVGHRGENQIIAIPGANGCVNSADVERLPPLLSEASTLLLQLEIPLGAVKAAAEAGKQAGVKVILDPAPAPQHLPKELYQWVDILTPNEVEASQLVGFPASDRASATQAAQELVRRGVKAAIVKLGDRGLVCATDDDCWFVPAYLVTAIDTVAAGDAFNASLAAALARGLPLPEALSWGAAAGALATTKAGAQSSLPDRKAVETFVAQNFGHLHHPC